MLVAYVSRTGNVEKFVEKLNMRSVRITEGLTIQEPYVLITYTTGFGQVPEPVMHFLQNNPKHLMGVSASGNRNWGESFAKSADRISQWLKVPVLSKFELSGTAKDVELFKREVSAVAVH